MEDAGRAEVFPFEGPEVGSREEKGLFKADEGSQSMKIMKIKALCLRAALGLAPFAANAAEGPGGEAAGEVMNGGLSSADALAKAGEYDRAILIIEKLLGRYEDGTCQDPVVEGRCGRGLEGAFNHTLERAGQRRSSRA